MESPFQEPGKVFENKRPLDEDYRPDEIIGREKEVAALSDAFQDVIEGYTPSNVFIYGQTGNGKTVVTRTVLELMEEKASEYGIDTTVIWGNCNVNDSLHSLLISLVNQLASEDDQVALKGPTHTYLWDRLMEELESGGDTVVIVLDEVDKLEDHNKLLYELPRAREHGSLSSTKVGVVGISNNHFFRDSLDSRVRSTLCEETIEFPPYDATELTDILNYYANLAFQDGVLDDGVISLCSAYAGQEQGDVRHALNILESAGNIARSEAVQTGTEQVTEGHVEEARQQVEHSRVETVVQEQFPQHVQVTAAAAVRLAITESVKPTTSNIYEEYKRICRQLDTEQRSRRRVTDFLGDIRLSGIFESKEFNTGVHDGRKLLYKPTVEPHLILEALLGVTHPDFESVAPDELSLPTN